MNIGYMRMVQKDPVRIWEVRDQDGKLLERGNCMKCTLTAADHGIKVFTVH